MIAIDWANGRLMYRQGALVSDADDVLIIGDVVNRLFYICLFLYAYVYTI